MSLLPFESDTFTEAVAKKVHDNGVRVGILLSRPHGWMDEHYWTKVQRAGANECWLWTGAHGPQGHGQMRIVGYLFRASALAWWLECGEWPGVKYVCHRCDVPACVNPSHLFLGDQKDNMRDCIAKGRFRFLSPSRGTLNCNAKLTYAKADQIRRMYASGVTLSELSRRFGMARSSLRRVTSGDGWRAEHRDAA